MRVILLLTFLFATALPAIADDLAAGRKLHVAKCAKCHKLYDPARYDDVKWNQWLDKMRGKAKLDDEQYRLLTAYLQTLRTKPK